MARHGAGVTEYSKTSHLESCHTTGCHPEKIATIYVETEIKWCSDKGLLRRNSLVPVDYLMRSLLNYYVIEYKYVGFFGHPK